MSNEIIVETAVSASEPQEVKGKVEKKGGKRIGYNYIILKSLKESIKNDVVKCIYIKSFTDFGLCVIKEGTAGDTKDKQNRDIKDRLIWQKELHQLLQNKVRVPRYIGSFEENGNYYLAIEHIKGKTLGKLCKQHKKHLRDGLLKGNKMGIQFMGYFLQVVSLLDTLHKHQIVHRDVTSANFIVTPGGKVALIDMELSYSIQLQMPSPPFMLGTHGYMSPEQLAVLVPTIKEDVFAAGAILLQIWTGLGPAKLTQAPFEELENKVNFFIPDKEIARITLQCLHPEASKRPPLSEVCAVIKKYRSDIKKGVIRKMQTPVSLDIETIKDTIQKAIYTLASPLLADKEKGWFAENHNTPPQNEKDKINKGWFTGFHQGHTGVLYLLSKAFATGFDIEATRPYIEHTLFLIQERYINQPEKVYPGLHYGSDGIAACVASAIQAGLIDNSEKHQDWINVLLNNKANILGISSGIAGQGIANMVSMPSINEELAKERLHSYVQYLLERQNENGSWNRLAGIGNQNQKSRITKGFADGVAGIVYFLLEYATCYKNQQALNAAENGLQWLIKNTHSNGNIIEWYSSENKRISPWWYDGSPGIALAFMKAYSLLGNPLYKKHATGALLYHPKEIFHSGLSQQNGLSGLGEIYLEAYQLLKDDQWIERANWIVQIIMCLRKHHVSGTYWLVENEKQPVSGIMLGNSGVLHFLLRHCFPDKIGFPLLPTRNSIPKIYSDNYELIRSI